MWQLIQVEIINGCQKSLEEIGKKHDACGRFIIKNGPSSLPVNIYASCNETL